MSDNLDNIMLDNSHFRDASTMRCLLDEIARCNPPRCNIMEVCGGQTFALLRYGIEELLHPNITLIHGPGCPVCVTPQSRIDAAIEIASCKDVILCTFGDMMRVPGSKQSLMNARTDGADIKILYSPIEIINIAITNPHKEVVFFAIGFETTTPIFALIVSKAEELGLKNISIITSLYTVPTAIYTLAKDSDCKIDALLAAGHVCAITGVEPYEVMAQELKIPIAITGFEPVDLLLGILSVVKQLNAGEHVVDNQYKRVVAPRGNIKATCSVNSVFEPCDVEWRGLGVIENSGMQLSKKYLQYDASKRFNLKEHSLSIDENCIIGSIMKGLKSPKDCIHFGITCNPSNPIGASMVSSEGVCAAYYLNKKS